MKYQPKIKMGDLRKMLNEEFPNVIESIKKVPGFPGYYNVFLKEPFEFVYSNGNHIGATFFVNVEELRRELTIAKKVN